ncbi:histidine phosphatase family protein [Sneathiella sp.]|uniref:histidine phosphatase family protein n=1 Tax=Sneathiella sp. TaxID=1964365 RepID=UPI00260479BA|nr:histidine phosphatase family protein [Sneathiella sp.]MDF2367719.1 histidine phosphatase family protein [Sneathiella sp.]
MVRLLVIRHGKTEWNLKRKIQGRTDIPLSELGRIELAGMRLPAEFGGFNWTSSPLKRTRETAELLGAKNLKIEPALIEMNWGEWEGETLSDLSEKYGAEFKYNESRGLNMTPPGGESPADVAARLKPWLQGLEADTIAVTHKGVIRALKSLAYNWDMTDKAPVKFDWATGHLFEVSSDGGLLPLRINISMEDA